MRLVGWLIGCGEWRISHVHQLKLTAWTSLQAIFTRLDTGDQSRIKNLWDSIPSGVPGCYCCRSATSRRALHSHSSCIQQGSGDDDQLTACISSLAARLLSKVSAHLSLKPQGRGWKKEKTQNSFICGSEEPQKSNAVQSPSVSKRWKLLKSLWNNALFNNPPASRKAVCCVLRHQATWLQGPVTVMSRRPEKKMSWAREREREAGLLYWNPLLVVE